MLPKNYNGRISCAGISGSFSSICVEIFKIFLNTYLFHNSFFFIIFSADVEVIKEASA